eukprot:3824964-Rhodomonas_salina.7
MPLEPWLKTCPRCLFFSCCFKADEQNVRVVALVVAQRDSIMGSGRGATWLQLGDLPVWLVLHLGTSYLDTYVIGTFSNYLEGRAPS